MRAHLRRLAHRLLLPPALAVALGLALPSPAAAQLAAAPPGHVTAVVALRGRPDLSALRALPRTERRRAVLQALRERSLLDQAPLRTALAALRLRGLVSGVTPLWAANALSVTAAPEVIRALAALPEVLAVTPDAVDVAPLALPTGTPEWNVQAVAAPPTWGLGYTGLGTVVASLDTGVDASHPDLAGRWRGGAGGWFDPYGQHATPFDPSGHGTMTMGVMVGGDASGTTIGVAPEAQWISAKIFDDAGRATATAIHLAFQWLLDPDGDPATDDAPDVVNNSWSFGAPGCNLEFQRDVQALLAAGIAPVFAAGNGGPYASSSVSPANYPESLSAGAIAADGSIWSQSSRGPNACTGLTYPSVSSPGVSVYTADLFQLYTTATGSSLASPQVAGVLALLREAYPAASVEQLEQALVGTAHDLGPAGPDQAYGAGLVDARLSLDALAAPPPPAPPTSAADAWSTTSGATLDVASPGVLANDAGHNGQPLTAVLVTGPAGGTLTLQPDGAFTYAPAAGFSGTDGFTYAADDGLARGTETQVTLTVTPPPRPPVAADDAVTVTAGTTAAVAAPGVLANDTDPDGRPLTAALVASPGQGTLALAADGSFSYTPAAGFTGADAFSYRAEDGLLASAPATVSITVVPPPNQPPVAADDGATVRRGSAVSVKVLANDRDPDGALVPASVRVGAAPAHGSATARADGTILYTPARRYTGADAFTYTVQDDAGATSNGATVRVQVR